MQPNDVSDDALFRDAVQGLIDGDFSRLEAVFASADGRRSRIVQWHEEGRFDTESTALAEALTCACFLGCTDVAEHLLRHGLDPSGGAATGLNAFHWAVNRGQADAVRLLLRWKAPLGARNMYGGNILDTAVWSAVNEPRLGQIEAIEQLLVAGARLDEEGYPTGNPDIDAMLKRYGAV